MSKQEAWQTYSSHKWPTTDLRDGFFAGYDAGRDDAVALLRRAQEFEESVHCPNGADYRCPFKSCKRCRGLAEIDTYLEGK